MRTLDDIIPPSRRPQSAEAVPPAPAPRFRTRGRFPLGTLVVVLLIVAVSAGALFYFSSALVKVTPQSRTATLASAALTATAGTGDLSFEIVTVQKVASQSVTSSGTRAVSSSAQGTITIYNAQSTTQKLIVNTRFQTASGLVYRVHAPVTIPGAKGGTPGSVNATVYADKQGSQYNVGPTSFTLPGLSGTPQFTQVTAKSASAMTGGASGNEPVVAEGTESATRAALMDSLGKDLTTALAAEVPKGYVLLPGASDTSYAPMPTVAGTGAGMADLKEQGTMRGVILPEEALAKVVATNGLGATYKGETVVLGDVSTLILKPATAFPAAGDQSFAFTLSGTATVISVIDPARVSAAVAGKDRAAAESVLKQYTEVRQAILVLRPFWRSSFPEDPAQIKVEVLPAASN